MKWRNLVPYVGLIDSVCGRLWNYGIKRPRKDRMLESNNARLNAMMT
jgi:hypothetical protein